jgi:SAM-dependent methyltransferase
MKDSFFSAMHRREVFTYTTAAVTAAATATLSANRAEAADVVKRLAKRGHDGIYARQPDLAMESKGDFYAGVYVWRGQDLERAAEQRAIEICAAANIDPKKEMSWGEAVKLIGDDPLISMTCRMRTSHQKLKYKMVQDFYHQHADEYLSEMEKADKLGPGTLELNPKMELLEYTTHEIHSMPGGYVGDEFAGHMYDCGTNWGAYVDRNFQDGSHMGMAANAATPKDGKVRRILDIGTSNGQFATSMKRRFPEAEVWGLDVGGPMVRYAHLRAADNGIDVNFVQRHAEKSGFPDNHFDIVVSNLLFHEVNYTGSQNIIKEVARVLRPGGVFSPTDDNYPPPTVKGKYTLWYNYRWNHEDWYADWHSIDFRGEMKKNGLKVAENRDADRLAPKLSAVKA